MKKEITLYRDRVDYASYSDKNNNAMICGFFFRNYLWPGCSVPPSEIKLKVSNRKFKYALRIVLTRRGRGLFDLWTWKIDLPNDVVKGEGTIFPDMRKFLELPEQDKKIKTKVIYVKAVTTNTL